MKMAFQYSLGALLLGILASAATFSAPANAGYCGEHCEDYHPTSNCTAQYCSGLGGFISGLDCVETRVYCPDNVTDATACATYNDGCNES